MSDSQTVWTILWNRAMASSRPAEPFEIAEVVPQVAEALHVDVKAASRTIGLLLTELARLPDGERFFRVEGNAVAPLPELLTAMKGSPPALAVYPYEL